MSGVGVGALVLHSPSSCFLVASFHPHTMRSLIPTRVLLQRRPCKGRRDKVYDLANHRPADSDGPGERIACHTSKKSHEIHCTATRTSHEIHRGRLSFWIEVGCPCPQKAATRERRRSLEDGGAMKAYAQEGMHNSASCVIITQSRGAGILTQSPPRRWPSTCASPSSTRSGRRSLGSSRQARRTTPPQRATTLATT